MDSLAAPPSFDTHPAIGEITGEWLLRPGAPSLHAWVPKGICIVLGASQTPADEVELEIAQRKNIPVYKRKGGGGAVVLGPHCLCLALRLRRGKNNSPLDYFRRIHAPLAEGLSETVGKRVTGKGISDLALGERKIAGTSLYLARDRGLYLASILVGQKARENMEALKQPSRQPDYREGRPHTDFLSTLEEEGYAGSPAELGNTLLPLLRSALGDLLDSSVT